MKVGESVLMSISMTEAHRIRSAAHYHMTIGCGQWSLIMMTESLYKLTRTL